MRTAVPERLTFEARREKAKELVESGMSQRKAADALGINQSTVSRALMQDASKSDADCITSDRDERREAAIVGNEALAAVEVIEPIQTFETIVLGLPWPTPSADVIQLRREAEADFDHARRLKAWGANRKPPGEGEGPGA